MELNEIKLKLKSGSGDSEASAAFFDAIFEDPEAKVTQTVQWGSEKQLVNFIVTRLKAPSRVLLPLALVVLKPRINQIDVRGDVKLRPSILIIPSLLFILCSAGRACAV